MNEDDVESPEGFIRGDYLKESPMAKGSCKSLEHVTWMDRKGVLYTVLPCISARDCFHEMVYVTPKS